MRLHLTQREVLTLVAALHAWQNELNYHTVEELRDYHRELKHHQPLNIEEVDRLLTRLGVRGASVSIDGTRGDS